MKSSYFTTLIQLLLLGAKNPIKLSTSDLAISIDKTQQTASMHLLFLAFNILTFTEFTELQFDLARDSIFIFGPTI